MDFLSRQLAPLLAAFAVWVFAAAPVLGQASREYDVKAAFLYNFTSFVEWPETAFAGPESPFVIGILGEDPFGKVLDEIVAGERVKNRPLQLKRFARLEDARECHILFVAASEKKRVREIANRFRNAPVLTVADIPEFTEAGGAVLFRTEENRLKLDIHVSVTRSAGLTVSSKLLKLSRVVGDAPQ